jgi:hypothetical protein
LGIKLTDQNSISVSQDLGFKPRVDYELSQNRVLYELEDKELRVSILARAICEPN